MSWVEAPNPDAIASYLSAYFGEDVPEGGN